jgi:hypothetical protein
MCKQLLVKTGAKKQVRSKKQEGGVKPVAKGCAYNALVRACSSLSPGKGSMESQKEKKMLSPSMGRWSEYSERLVVPYQVHRKLDQFVISDRELNA